MKKQAHCNYQHGMPLEEANEQQMPAPAPGKPPMPPPMPPMASRPQGSKKK